MRKMWPCADGGEGDRKRMTATTPSIVTSDSVRAAAGMAMLMSGACIRTCPQRVIRVIRPVIRNKILNIIISFL